MMKTVKSRKSIHSMRIKAIHLALASCFAATPALSATLADYNYAVLNGTAISSINGATRTIKNSPNAILYWGNGLSINLGETLHFDQLSAQSAVLNRVGGGNLTQILGTLSSNGKVFLINPAGITIGAGARVDTAGFVASSLNMTDADFLNGKMRFNADTATPGSVINQGEITTPNGGFVYLVAPQVANQQSGIITTPSGEAILAAGNSVELVDSTNPALRVVVKAQSQDANLSQAMKQSGGDIFSVLNSGKISANTAVVGQNGKIQFRSAGKVETTATSIVEVKGDSSKDGGYFRGFADGSGIYAGQFNASGQNGGLIETSAAYLSLGNISVTANAMSKGGHGGEWLLDPYDFVINSQEAANIKAALDNGTSVSIDTGNNYFYGGSSGYNYYNVGTGGLGDITINSAIIANNSYGSPILTLHANHSVIINADIKSEGTGSFGVVINADGGGVAINNAVVAAKNGGSVNMTAGNGDILMSGVASRITGDYVYLAAYGGSIGANNAHIRTATPHLSAYSDTGDVYVADIATLSYASIQAANKAELHLHQGIAYGGTINMTADKGSVIGVDNDLILDDVDIHFSGGGEYAVIAKNTAISMNNSSIDVAYGGGDLAIGATNGINMVSSSISAPDDVFIITPGQLNMSHSHISGSFVGVNHPGVFSDFTKSSLTNLVSVAKSSSINMSEGSSISGSQGVGIMTGALNIVGGSSGEQATYIHSGENMEIFVAGDLNITGGTGVYSDAYLSTSQEALLVIGGHLNLKTSENNASYAAIDVGSPETLYMNFPLLAKDGFTVDGVANSFVSTNEQTGIFVNRAPAKLDENTFVTYNALNSAEAIRAVTAIKNKNVNDLTKTSDTNKEVVATKDAAEKFFGKKDKDKDDDSSGSSDDKKDNKQSPKECG